jgi:serine/threonine-protein kinase
MVTTELGQCEWFIWDLRRSNLIDRGQLDQVVGEYMQTNPRAEPPALAEFLIQKGILSQFQADRLLQGKTQGFVLGPFTLMDALGTGSMGTVYKAQSKNDAQWYAVKVLPRRSMWNVRIARRKVRAFEACKHPTVVPFVDVGTAGGMHYLAWPFIEGEPLDKIVEAQGTLSPGLAAHYVLQIAEGLEICHHQALFHGLLKPSNLMVGTGHQIHILDFGIGCLLAETEGESLVDTMSTANSVASGLDCASPESIMDPQNLTPAGDQYSLGCVLYYCLTGRYPFPDGSSAEKMMAHQFKQPTPVRELRPEVPQGLAEVVQRLMQKAPEQRYGSAADVVEALKVYAEVPVGNVRPRPGPRPLAPVPQAPGDNRPAPVSPSTPTPRPQQQLNLPSRQTVRGAAPAPMAPAAKPPVEEPKAKPPAKPVVASDYSPSEWMDQTISPITVMIVLGAVVAVTWALFAILM